MSDRPLNVLFVCTGNSARSILAESILNHPAIGQGRFRALGQGPVAFFQGPDHVLSLIHISEPTRPY